MARLFHHFTLALVVAGLLQQANAAPPSTAAERWAAWERHQQMHSDGPLRGLQWRAIGPIVQGGRIVDIENVPGEPYSFYVAYASGGVWKTTNATDPNGPSWTPLTDFEASLSIGALALDPTDSGADSETSTATASMSRVASTVRSSPFQ